MQIATNGSDINLALVVDRVEPDDGGQEVVQRHVALRIERNGYEGREYVLQHLSERLDLAATFVEVVEAGDLHNNDNEEEEEENKS